MTAGRGTLGRKGGRHTSGCIVFFSIKLCDSLFAASGVTDPPYVIGLRFVPAKSVSLSVGGRRGAAGGTQGSPNFDVAFDDML